MVDGSNYVRRLCSLVTLSQVMNDYSLTAVTNTCYSNDIDTLEELETRMFVSQIDNANGSEQFVIKIYGEGLFLIVDVFRMIIDDASQLVLLNFKDTVIVASVDWTQDY